MEPTYRSFLSSDTFIKYIEDPSLRGTHLRFKILSETQNPLVIRISKTIGPDKWYSLTAEDSRDRPFLVKLISKMAKARWLNVEPAIKEEIYDYFREFAWKGASSKKCVYELNGLIKSLTHFPSPLLNGVIGNNGKSPSQEVVKNEIEYFTSTLQSFAWFVDLPSDPETENRLIENGFKSANEFRAYARDIESIPLPRHIKDKGVLVVKETDPEKISIALSFLSFSIKPFYLEDARSEHPRFQHWTALMDNKTVAVLTTIRISFTVFLVNAFTDQEYRRKGLMTRLCYNALSEAMSRGCNTAIALVVKNSPEDYLCQKMEAESHWNFKTFILNPSPR